MEKQSTRIISAAREILKSYGYFVDNLWHINDIGFLCEQRGLPRLPPEEAYTVFDIANAQFDGEHGINWPQLEQALTLYLEQRQALSELCLPDRNAARAEALNEME